jgi:hypothetical protein
VQFVEANSESWDESMSNFINVTENDVFSAVEAAPALALSLRTTVARAFTTMQ